MIFTTLAVALLASSITNGASATRLSSNKRKLDSVCGEGFRLRYAVQCNDDSVTLYPGPNNNKIDYCANPNDSWLEAKCKEESQGGLAGLLTAYSGCYPESPEFWLEFMGLVIVDGDEIGPVTLHIGGELDLPNMGFEDGNFNSWTLSTQADAFVTCGTPEAVEGGCFATVEASGCPPHVIERGFTLPPVDLSCELQVPGSGRDYCITFSYRFDAVDYLPFNDYMMVSIGITGTTGTNILNSDYIDIAQVGDYGDSGWRSMSVTIPAGPAEIPYEIVFNGAVGNGNDCGFDSAMKLDGFSISVGACA